VTKQVHNWNALEDAAETVRGDDEEMKETREVLKKLLDHIRFSPELIDYFKTRQSYLDARITDFDSLWSLFVPGI
jgi:hypothetical protein